MAIVAIKLKAGYWIDRLQTHVGHSITWNMFLHFVALWPWLLTFWPNIKWLARTHYGLYLWQVWWLIHDRQTWMNALLPRLSSAWVNNLSFCIARHHWKRNQCCALFTDFCRFFNLEEAECRPTVSVYLRVLLIEDGYAICIKSWHGCLCRRVSITERQAANKTLLNRPGKSNCTTFPVK